MLRLVENNIEVNTVSVPEPVLGVDTQEDLERVRDLMIKDTIFPKYSEQYK